MTENASSSSPTATTKESQQQHPEDFGSPYVVAALRRKPIEHLETSLLHRSLGLIDCVSIGIANIVGAGIFVITGIAAAKFAGPALIFSFLISGFGCGLTWLCYAELAAAVPGVGSSFLYANLFIGEWAAYTVGACLTLEYILTASAVGVGWTATFIQLLWDCCEVKLPYSISNSMFTLDSHHEFAVRSPDSINLITVMLLSAISVVISFGVEEGKVMTVAAVIIKVGVLLIFVIYGFYWKFSNPEKFSSNQSPFFPENERFGRYGWSGVITGSSTIVFSLIGGSTIAAMAAEVVHPERDIPRALVIVLICIMILYISVTYVLTGMVPWRELDVEAPVPWALQQIKAPHSMLLVVDLGAVVGLFSVCLVALLAMTRIMMGLARDKMVPAVLGDVDPKYKVPRGAIVFVGFCSCLLGALFSLDMLSTLVSAGTLIAFIATAYALIVKRREYPDFPTPYAVPGGIVIPVLSICFSVFQFFFLPLATIRNFCVAYAAALIFYFFYRLNGVAAEVEKERAQRRREAETAAASVTRERAEVASPV